MDLKTATFSMENLCVPCGCRCRHCLLDCNSTTIGVSYEQGKELARRIASESPILFSYYIGCSMDTPQLLDYIGFCQEIGSPGGRFLQMNGLQIRPQEEIRSLVEQIQGAGVKMIDLTFYGSPVYHDRFAGRPGDFSFLGEILRAAAAAGLEVEVSVTITEENALQMVWLFGLLSLYGAQNIHLILPHAKGRGWYLDEKRLRESTLKQLPEEIRASMLKTKVVSEAQWLEEGVFPEPTERHLTLSLTPQNLSRCQAMSAADMIQELEQMDDTFYAAIPPAAELAKLYGDPKGDKLYRYRDLVLLWTQRYVREHPISAHDMTDERGSFSLRQ